MDNQSKPCESYSSKDTPSTMDPGGQLDAKSQTSHKRVENYSDEPTDAPEAPSAALVRKRFRDFLDEPETWEKNLLPTQKSSAEDGGAQELSRLSDLREKFKNDAPECRSKRRRRNAIKPNSITQRVAKDVADCHYLKENAVATGRVLNAEEIALSGLHDRFKDAAVGATKDPAGNHNSPTRDDCGEILPVSHGSVV